MSDRKIGRRGLLGLFGNADQRSPSPPSLKPTEPPPTQSPAAFSLERFYATRTASGERNDDTLPVVARRTDISVETTRIGTPELNETPATPPWAPTLSKRLPNDQVPLVRPYACLAFRGVCSVCVERCPVEGAILVELGRPKVDPSKCDGCGACVGACPAPVNGFDLVARVSANNPNV